MQTLTNMTHNETNTSCPQNRCGEWSKCNNGECEGMHDCTCETPIESWEEEFDETFILGDYNAGTTAKYNNIKDFIRTKLAEAFKAGEEKGTFDGMNIQLNVLERTLDNQFGFLTRMVSLESLKQYIRDARTDIEARHAGEVSNQM